MQHAALTLPAGIGFVRSPLPPALAIAGIITTGLVCAGISPRPSVLVMVLCLTYASYAIDRLVDEGDAGRPTRAWLVCSASLAFAASFAVATWLAGPATAALAGMFPLAVAAYCVPWLGRRGIRRVKDIPWTKNLYTAACVALAGLWAAQVSGAAPGQLGCVALILLVQEFVNTAASDLADLDDDRRRGVPTLVLRWGRGPTLDRLAWIAGGLALALGLGASLGWLVGAAAFAAGGGLLVQAYLLVLRGPCSYGFAKLAPDLSDLCIGLLALLGWALTR